MTRTMPAMTMYAVVTGALITLVLFGVLGGGLEEPATSPPKPFDPLSDEERVDAMAITLDDANISQSLSERHTAIGAALYTDKSQRDLDPWPRMAEVWLYDYGHNQAVRAFIDLTAETVVQWDTPDVQPPAASHEVQAAGEDALQDDRVRDRLTDQGHDPGEVGWTARLWVGPGATACPEHRCLLVSFINDQTLIEDFTVLVDLTVPDVTRLLGPHGTELEDDTGGFL